MIPAQGVDGHDQQAASVYQPSLFPPPVFSADPSARRSCGSETSRLAHERIAPCKGAVRSKILALAQARGTEGATVHEVAEALGTTPNCISGRLTELRIILGRLAYKFDDAGGKVKRRGACVLVATGGPPGP
jgi:hypothetical protein